MQYLPTLGAENGSSAAASDLHQLLRIRHAAVAVLLEMLPDDCAGTLQQEWRPAGMRHPAAGCIGEIREDGRQWWGAGCRC